MSHDFLYHVSLGVVQGLTEFLPVSSSAHLVITQNLFGFEEPQLVLDIVLHLGTLAAVALFLWKEIFDITLGTCKGVAAFVKREAKLFDTYPDFFTGVCVIVATVPTGLMGVLFKDKFEAMFGSLTMVGFFLLVTGCVLFTTKFVKVIRAKKLTVFDALIIGVAQGIAICPGISRSGITITSGILRRLDPVFAAKFSFLLSIPAILGAALLHIKDLHSVPLAGLGYLAAGFLSSAVSGYLSLAVLMRIVKNFKLYYFSYYCWVLGTAVIMFAK
jgi:undecaprenyl-diphosphatase